MLTTILIIILILLLLGAFPSWPYSRGWGDGPSGVVGLMIALVMGVRRPDILDRACDLGIAFQLTNIARDSLR